MTHTKRRVILISDKHTQNVVLKAGEENLMTNLKKYRERAGYTQIQIADMVELSERGYQRIESGEQTPNVMTAQRIAKALDVTVEKLFQDNIEKGSVAHKIVKKLYDVDEFRSEILNNKLSKSTIYAKIKSGEIKAIKIGKRPFIPAWYVDELLTSRNI